MELITNKLNTLSLDSQKQNSSPDPVSLNEFCARGTAGRCVFENNIIPFLDLNEVLSCASTSRRMNAACRTYTVGEMELGKLVLSFVSPRYTEAQGDFQSLARRKIYDGTDSYWARLYHSSQLPEVKLAMVAFFAQNGIPYSEERWDDFDWEKEGENSDPTIPVFVRAVFGSGNSRFDVTAILRYVLMQQGNKNLKLRRPQNCGRYWYICLFGDPIPRVTKLLTIVVRDSTTGKVSSIRFVEDKNIDIPLRVAASAKGDEDFESLAAELEQFSDDEEDYLVEYHPEYEPTIAPLHLLDLSWFAENHPDYDHASEFSNHGDFDFESWF